MNTRVSSSSSSHKPHLAVSFTPALFLDCFLSSAWSVILWSMTRVSVCHSGVHSAGKRKQPCQKETNVVLMFFCGGIQGQSDWGLFFFFLAMLKVFWYFICFVLCKSHWKTKQRTALACCLCSRSLISGCFRGSCCCFSFVFFLLRCIHLILLGLFSQCSYAKDLTMTPYFVDDESQYLILNVVSRTTPWARRPSKANEQLFCFFFFFQAAFMPLDSLSLEKKWKSFHDYFLLKKIIIGIE